MNLNLQMCTLEDLEELQEISRETFYDTFGSVNKPEDIEAYMERAYAPEQLKQEMSETDSVFYFLYDNQEIVGYLKLNKDGAQTEPMGENALEVERIYIRPAYKRQGYGSYLIQKAENIALKMAKNKIWLGVWEDNDIALAFYSKRGFKQIGSHSFYMGEDEQVDLIMEKQL